MQPVKTLMNFTIFLVVLLLPISLGVIVTNCRKETTEKMDFSPLDSPKMPSRGFFMGILPTPAQDQTFEQSYDQASLYVEFVPVWGRPSTFYELANELRGEWGKTFLEGYIRQNRMFPLIQVNFYGVGITLITPPGLEGATLSDPEWRKAYLDAILDVVKSARPLYISIGNEVNRWYEKYGASNEDPNSFKNYLSLYEKIYDTLKVISPGIKVFCTFSREIVAENREANLDVLGLFDTNKLDLLVLTSYPYAVQGIIRPSDIPSDYYSRVLSYVGDKPFGISELGWPSFEEFGGEKGQAEFLQDVINRLIKGEGIKLELFGWAWLHDLDQNDGIGLIKHDGTEKLAYDVWKSISQP